MKKKILSLLLVGLMVFNLTGCGSDTPSDYDKDDFTGYGEEMKQANIKETVILERNGIKITAKSIDYSGFMGPEIKVLIENNGSKDVTVQTRYFSVNGLMVDATFSVDVSAGKKANDSIIIDGDILELSGIEAIANIEFDFDVFESSTYNDIFEEKDVKLTTDLTNYTQKYNTAGNLVVDKNGIKIYSLKVVDGTLGPEVVFYLENNTKKNVYFGAKEVSVDGFMLDAALFSEIEAGKKAYATMWIDEDELEKNEITKVNNVDLKFTVYDEDYDDLVNTETIKLSF